MAEVMKFQDFKEEGSENAVKVSSQRAQADEQKSPVISGADSSPLLRGRNYCTHSGAAPDKPTRSALNTAIVLQLCISLSQCVLTGCGYFSQAALLHLARRLADL